MTSDRQTDQVSHPGYIHGHRHRSAFVPDEFEKIDGDGYCDTAGCDGGADWLLRNTYENELHFESDPEQWRECNKHVKGRWPEGELPAEVREAIDGSE